MVPATAPISLLVATLTVQREKEHYYHPVKNKQQTSASELWSDTLRSVTLPIPFKAPPLSLVSGEQYNCAFIFIMGIYVLYQ